jgi:hypothetical protein
MKYPNQINDYTIAPYYTYLEPELKKYMVSLGGCKISVFKTYVEAAELVVKLVVDPWHLDRGWTASDRAKRAGRTR